MDKDSLTRAARVIAARNVNDRIVGVAVAFDEIAEGLAITYFVDGLPTEDEIELCELSCAELLAEFLDIRAVETKCVDWSDRSQAGERQELVYSTLTYQAKGRDPWPFEDPPNVAVILDGAVMSGSDWIAMAARDEEDGAWQFVGSRAWRGEVPLDDAAAKVVSLANVLKLDPSIGALHKMPAGFRAHRENLTASWVTEAKYITR